MGGVRFAFAQKKLTLDYIRRSPSPVPVHSHYNRVPQLHRTLFLSTNFKAHSTQVDRVLHYLVPHTVELRVS